MNYEAADMKTREAVIQAGKTRIIPVLLTALAAILALIPLAVGFNIDFVTMFSELNPTHLLWWRQRQFLEAIGLDYHLWFSLCIFYDPGYCAGNVPDCRAAKTPDAQAIWWHMDKHAGHTSFHVSVHSAGHHYNDKA